MLSRMWATIVCSLTHVRCNRPGIAYVHYKFQTKTAALLAHGHNSANGIYHIINVCSTDEDGGNNDSVLQPMRVVCDMETDGGGWTVIMKRKRLLPANLNFNRGWVQYENGFGNLNTEFWLGLRNIHCLTTREDVDMMIDLRDNYGNGMTWIYHLFRVNGSDDKYRLQIGQSEGPSGGFDAMAYHNGNQFSTRDNDGTPVNCARFHYPGGWWHDNPGCFSRGSYLTGPHTDADVYNRLLWYTGDGGGHKYYENVVMKVRSKSCASKCKN